MQKHFVLVACDVDCQWTGNHPRYRVYVNNELFAERTWIWQNEYLEENIQMEAPSGFYQIKIELLDKEHATLTVSNMRVLHGPAIVKPNGELTVSG